MNIKNLFLFILFPVLINCLLIGLYFSGNLAAQQFAAPTIQGLSSDSWREFGLVEQLQNIYLLGVLAILINAARVHEQAEEKIFFGLATLFVLFLLLEEIDYGLHFYELLRGEYSGIEVRNWHNEKIGSKQNVVYLKKIADIIMVLWFIILPIVKIKINNPIIRKIIPSRWFIGTLVVALIMSKFAHLLDDLRFGMIDGVRGNLEGNISEFRETSNYYLYLLYANQLSKVNSPRTFKIFHK